MTTHSLTHSTASALPRHAVGITPPTTPPLTEAMMTRRMRMATDAAIAADAKRADDMRRFAEMRLFGGIAATCIPVGLFVIALSLTFIK